MKWHIICRIGEDDTFFPELDRGLDQYLVLNFGGGPPNERVRENVISSITKKCNRDLLPEVCDFLYASMAVYLADLCIPRRTAEDRWSRDLKLHMPVFKQSRWRSAGKAFASTLGFLTGDSWTISTRERAFKATGHTAVTNSSLPKHVCLLSGGLDSLVGAIDLLCNEESVAFVSHHGGGMTAKFQNDIFGRLNDLYEGQCFENQFYIVPPKLGGDGENSMRSRSILFLGLGISVASALGDDVPLIVPENGLISMNVPLTGPRTGSSSTRTTHPHFIGGVRQVLSRLGIHNDILLPYRHSTKGEMLANTGDIEALKSLLSLSMSCSHPEVARWEGATPGTHCGYCFPCLIRRAAVTAADLEDFDAEYIYDVRHETPKGKKISDLRAVKIALFRDRKVARSNILHVLEAGPLPAEEISEFADVYARGMSEIRAFLDGEH